MICVQHDIILTQQQVQHARTNTATITRITITTVGVSWMSSGLLSPLPLWSSSPLTIAIGIDNVHTESKIEYMSREVTPESALSLSLSHSLTHYLSLSRSLSLTLSVSICRTKWSLKNTIRGSKNLKGQQVLKHLSAYLDKKSKYQVLKRDPTFRH